MLNIFLALFLFVSSAYPLRQQTLGEPRMGYHRLIGIPAAKGVKAREDAIRLEDNSRVYKGQEARIYDYPFYVGVLTLIKYTEPKRYSLCGGSLVSSTRVITAAHCWKDGDPDSPPDMMKVVLGSEFMFSGGVRVQTREVYQHPQYNDYSSKANDIAVAYLPYRVNFTRAIFPTALPIKGEQAMSLEGLDTIAIGNGVTEGVYHPPITRSIRSINLKIVPDTECIKHLGKRAPGIICTSGKGHAGLCHGDSGGPLITYTSNRKILIGVAVAIGGTKCGEGELTAYSRISSYMEFIESHVILPKFTFKYELHEVVTVTEDGVTSSHSSVHDS